MSGLDQASSSSAASARASGMADANFSEQTPGQSDSPQASATAKYLHVSASARLPNGEDEAKSGQKPAKTEQSEWTIALDLTTDYTSDLGVQSRLKEMRELSAQTKDTHVSFIVQAAVPRSEFAILAHARIMTRLEGSRLAADSVDHSKNYDIERYLVAGGEMKKLEVVPSQGYARDLEALIGFTSAYPSKRLGLIEDSHGKGNQGLMGNTGSIDMHQFTEAVSHGLTQTRHAKMNFLDFDGCLMGQQGVLDAIKAISTDVVASPEIEENEGQNVMPALGRLLNDAKMSGGMLADEFVLWQSDPNSKPHAIHTLAHYDMSHYNAWRASLNSFGDQLSRLAKDATNKSVLEGIITKTNNYNYDPFDPDLTFISNDPKFDLKSFVDGVVQAAKKGELKDPDGLLSTASSLLNKEQRLIKSFYADKYYAGYGGMSVALPNSWMMHPEVTSTLADQLAQTVKLLEDPSIKPSERSSDLAWVDSKIKNIEHAESTNPDLSDSLKAVQDADRNLHNAASKQDFLLAAKQLQAAIEVMQVTPYSSAEKSKQVQGNKAETTNYFRLESIPDQDGWGRFRYQMIPQSGPPKDGQ